MCKHTKSTVVTGGKLAIHQCDFCGAMLWWEDVEGDAVPLPVDVSALEMSEKQQSARMERDWEKLQRLKAQDPAAYKAEVRRRLGSGDNEAPDLVIDFTEPDIQQHLQIYLARIERLVAVWTYASRNA